MNRSTNRLNYVLPAMVDTSSVGAQTIESCTSSDPCNVHGSLPDRFLSGKETLHSVHFSVFSDSISYML